jgi:hypothetical protein
VLDQAAVSSTSSLGVLQRSSRNDKERSKFCHDVAKSLVCAEQPSKINLSVLFHKSCTFKKQGSSDFHVLADAVHSCGKPSVIAHTFKYSRHVLYTIHTLRINTRISQNNTTASISWPMPSGNGRFAAATWYPYQNAMCVWSRPVIRGLHLVETMLLS